MTTKSEPRKNYYIFTIKIALKYINQFHMYWFWFGVRIIYIAIEVALPIIFGIIINELVTSNNDLSTAGFWIMAYIVLQIIGPFIEVSSGNTAWVYGAKCAGRLREDTIYLLKYAGLNYWQDKSRGEVMKVIDKSYDLFYQLTALVSHQYLWMVGRIIGIFIASTFIDPVILLIYLVDAIFFFLNLYILLPKEKKADLAVNRQSESLNGKIYQYLQNFRTIVYLNLFARQDKAIKEEEKELMGKITKRERLEFHKWLNNNELHNLTTVAIFLYALWQIQNGQFDIGMLTTVILFANTFSSELGNLVWRTNEFVQFSNAMQRYDETFGSIIADPESLKPTEGVQFQNLSLENVSLERDERETLRNVNFNLKKGEKLALVGYTGSGKSTLLDITLKVITDYDGQVKINQRDYHDLKVADVMNIFSIVPQEVQLFKDTIRGNILASNSKFSGDLDRIVDISGLSDLIAKLPDGLDTVIQESSTNFSGGERQRIGIARALVQEQPVLVLDEATASLDPKTEREVVTNIIKNYPDLTIIYVTHKYSLLNYFDQILVLDSGRIVEQGSFEKLLAGGGLFKDLHEASQG